MQLLYIPQCFVIQVHTVKWSLTNNLFSNAETYRHFVDYLEKEKIFFCVHCIQVPFIYIVHIMLQHNIPVYSKWSLTSLDLIRYLTIRPRKAASVWLSKSGEFMPEIINHNPLSDRINLLTIRKSSLQNLTCDTVHQHLPTRKLLLQLSDLTLLMSVCKHQLYRKCNITVTATQ